MKKIIRFCLYSYRLIKANLIAVPATKRLNVSKGNYWTKSFFYTLAVWMLALFLGLCQDCLAQNIVSVEPKNGEANINPGADLVITFDVPIEAGKGQIEIIDRENNKKVDQVNVNNKNFVNIADKTATIDTRKDFPAGRSLYIIIPDGAFIAIEDQTEIAGITDPDAWNFVIEGTTDETAPMFTSLSPQNAAAEVAIDTVLAITFDEAVQAGSGNIVITQGDTSQSIAIGDAAISINGNRVTIDPPADFPYSDTVTVSIPAGAFTDLAGNAFAGIAADWTFTTMAAADTQAPVVISYAPADEATNIALDASLILTFDETVEKGAGTILISHGATSQTIPVSDQSVSVSGTTVTINPPTDFPSQSPVSVQIAAGAFRDVSGNDFAGIMAATIWNFSTDDKTAPVVTGLSPADNFIGVEANANLVLTFSESIKKGTGNLIVHQGLVTQTIPVTDPAVLINANVVSIDPPQDFPLLAAVWVEIPQGAFTDLSGNSYGGMSEASEWNFTVIGVIDNSAPELAATTPADGAANVLTTENLVLTFSEEIVKGTGNITLSQEDTSQSIPVAANAVKVNGNIVTIDPPVDFPQKNRVSVQIESGAFTDLAGNAFAGIADTTTWNFVTEDKTAPTITALSPADDATEVAINASLVITFDEEVEKGTGNVVITQGSSSQTIAVSDAAITVNENIVTITPPADFPEGTRINVQIVAGAFTDAANNNFVGIPDTTTWNFVTEDVTAPAITALSPADGEANVAADTNLVITFSEVIQKGSGSITLIQGTSTQVIDVTSALVEIAGNAASINPAEDLLSGAAVSVQIEAGAFKDEAGNLFNGIADNTTWNFSIADTESPVIAGFTPADDSTGIAWDAGLQIEYNEPVEKGTGIITITQGTDNQAINVSDAAVSISGTTVTIDPPADFPANALVSIQIPADAFKDLSGNGTAAIADTTTWNFTTAAPPDTTTPLIAMLSPADEALGIGVSDELMITFSEPVKKGAGNLIITQGSSSQTIAVSDAAITVNENIVTIDPPVDFPEKTAISIQIESGTFTDLAENDFAGITDTTTWNFVTEDKTAPIFTSLSPQNAAAEVAIDTVLAITFDEAVQAGSGNIVITQREISQSIAIGDAAISINGNRVTIDPPADFPYSDTVTVSIPAGAFTDLAGNAFAGIAAADWTFTTIAAVDSTAPAVTALSPATGTIDVPVNVNLILSFDEPIEKGAGSISINDGSNTQVIEVNSGNVTVNENQATIDLPDDFAEGALIRILIQTGAFRDLAGNDFTGIIEETIWNFTTADTTLPQVSELSPADGATNIAKSTNLVLTFSEPVQKGAGVITITEENNSQTIPVGDAAVSIAGAIVTIDPPADLMSGKMVAVEFPAGTFTDMAGNNHAGISGTNAWNFTTADEEVPLVTAFSPADGATNVAVDTSLVLTFNERVLKGNGNIVIHQDSSTQTIAVSDAAVVVSDSTVTIYPPASFPSQAAVWIEIDPGTFTDTSNNVFAGIASETVWNFVVQDIAAPLLTSRTPADDAIEVAIDASLVLEFNEAVKTGTGNITLNLGTATQEIPVTGAAVSIAGNTVTIDPADFPHSATVTVTIPTGAFTDAAGNAFAGIAADWSFITQAAADETPPAITTFAPQKDAANVSTTENLVLTFSEEIVKGTGNITLSQEDTSQSIPVTANAIKVNGNIVTIDPPVDFPQKSRVSVQIESGAFTDLAGNAFAGIADTTTWNFVTEDISAPAITALSPADDATEVAINASLVITFDEAVIKGTGTITVNQGENNQQINIAGTSVSIEGTKVTIDLPADMPEGAQVYVQLPAGAFTDLGGNPSAAITGNTTWNFTTTVPVDISPPIISALTPANNATNVPIDASLVLEFDEAVNAGTGEITIAQGEASQNIPVTGAAVSIAGNTVTIDPADFPHSATITVTIPTGAFTDAAGNAFAGIAAADWSFSILAAEDETAPVVDTYVPADEAANIAVTENLTLTFSEAIVKGIGTISIIQGATTQMINVAETAVSIAGNQVTIDPPADFPNGTNISVQIPAGVFKDLAGNNFAGIANTTTWNFSTTAPEDITPPTLSTFTPSHTEADVAINTNLVLTFSEPVVAGAGNILISQGATSQTIAVTDAAVSLVGEVVTIDPPADFPNSATITITVPAGAFTDAAGNAFAGISAGTWSFTTAEAADTEAPVVTTYAPVDNASAVALDASLGLTFGEPVEKGSGNIILTQGANSQTIPVTDASVSITGAQVTINPPADFPAETTIIVQIEAGAFRDVAGNNFAGITDNTTWNFTTLAPTDETPPAISKLSPAHNATAIAVTTDLILEFTEAVKTGTGSIIINDGTTSQTIAVTDAAVSIADNIVTLNPPADFPHSATITITVPQGAFTDLAGNAFAGITATEWSFATVEAVDNEAPVVTAYSPVNGAGNVPAVSDLTLTFNEDVIAGTGIITIIQEGGNLQINVPGDQVSIAGNTVTINPAADLLAGKDIVIQIEAGTFTDVAGNDYAGIDNTTTWAFTTEEAPDVTAPGISEFSPADDAADVALNTNLVVTFDEEVLKGSGNIVITQGTVSQTIAVTDASVMVNGSIVTIDRASDFEPQAQVYVQMDTGVFTDISGNEFAGITNNTTWNFTTAAIPDNTAPATISLAPANAANNVTVDASLVLTFSEPVVAGAGNILISQGATSQTIAVTDAAVSLVGEVVTIDPPADFPNSATITITVPAGAFTDAAGNAFAGISAGTWSFTTAEAADTEAPVITAYAPVDDAADVPITSDLTITFNEPVIKGTGNIVVTQGEASQTIAVTDDAVTIAGTTVTINPPVDFPEGTQINVQIVAGAFTDAANNNFAGIADNTTWNFTTASTPDQTAPALTSFTPANNATGVAVNTDLVLTFDEPVKIGTGDIVINQGETSQTIAVTDAAVTINATTVTLNPADFPHGATITIAIPQGAFTDLAGNNFAGIPSTNWSFTIVEAADATPPVISSVTPADETINVPLDINLEITFSEAVVKGVGDIVINQGETSQTIAVTEAAVNINGATVTINLPADLPDETSVSIQIAEGAFTDLAGNAFAGITDAATWNFTTVLPADNTAPLLSAFSPPHNAGSIGVGENLTLTFSEPVVKGEGTIVINQGNTTQDIDVTSAAITVNGNEVTIDPPADFPNGTIITVTVPAGAFRDEAGNLYTGIVATDWSFSTEQALDETAPVLTEASPADGAANVAANENIILTFDENVTRGLGNIVVNQGTTSQTIPVTDAALVSITGNLVTINPPADFPNSATITVTIPAGAFTDASGNTSAAITRTFSITAPADATEPIISSLSPPDNATEVPVNADLVITFNEEVKKGTGSITITQGANTQTINVSSETVSIQGTTVTINPPQDFPSGAAVSVQMPVGIFTDLAGNPFAGITDATTWNFTIAIPADNTAPQVVSFAPADNAQNIAPGANLIITFNEPVKKGRGNLIINLGSSTQTLNVASEAVTVQGNTVTINPPEDFPSGANVNILMLSGVFTDLANNSYAGIDNAETWNFSVPDNIPPVRTLLYPPDNSTDVPPNINLIMVFSENIKKGSGNITITREGAGQTQVVDVNSDAVTVSGTTVIINPAVNFPAAATVSIQMPAGLFTDNSGNPYAGISDPTEWNLTISGTVDVTPPVITAFLPEDNAVNVAPTSNLTITFNENVQKGNGNITITQGSTSQVIPVTGDAVSIEGTTVTIDPPDDMPEGAVVHVQFPAGVFSDVSNNNFAGITNATTWNFTVNTAAPSDNTPPAVATLSPADDAVDVALDANLVITFNEAVKKGSGLIVIQQNNTSRVINVNSAEVSVNGNVVTINPATNFPANRPLSVQITEGTFRDIAGNDFEGINDETAWNFTTGAPVDNTAPSVTAFSPADNANNVAVNANLVITFNENIKKGSGNITITQGTTSQTINVNSNAVSIAGNRVTINPPADFPVSTAISVQMPAGVITDNAGNSFAGINNTTTWNFTTAAPADNTPPTVTSFSPADGAENVAVDAVLTITFSEPVVKGTGNIVISQGANSQTIAVTNGAVSIAGATVTINPPEDFPAGTEVSVQIEAGAFKDAAGNNFAGIANATTWNFTTVQPADTTPPQVLTLSPGDNAQNVAVNANLVITFNEAVKAGTGTIVINQGNTSQSIVVTSAAVTFAGTTLTINLPADFPEGATIGVEIPQGAITDLAGNAYEGIDATQWSFTVAPGADSTPPQISAFSPANNAANVAVNVNLGITFNEAIEKGTGNIVIRQGNTILHTIAVTNASVTVSGNTLTINPPANLPTGTLINVQLEAGVVKDVAGNAFAGITNATTWRFTTLVPADTTPPALSSLSPANGAVNVAVNSNLVLTFNETIKKKTGNITLTVNGIAQLIPVTDASVTVSGNTVTINPPTDFPLVAAVSVEVPAGVFTDAAGNNFAGISAEQWAFTVIAPLDNEPPVVSAFSPDDNSTDVGVNATLVITFSEPVDKGTGLIEIREDGELLTIPVSNPVVSITGNSVTIDPPADFGYGSSVNIRMPAGAFVDKAGNDFAGITDATTWNFEVALLPDNTPPVITTLSPADDAQNVAATANLVITFDEQVQKGAGTISIFQNGTVQQIPVSDPAVTLADNVVTIEPTGDFTFEADVFVEIEPGTFKDNSDNSFAGFNGNQTWNFTIEPSPDPDPPAIVSLSPEDDAVNVAPDTDLTITFSEPIQKGTGTIILTQGTSSQTIDINSSAVTISEAVLMINPETDFPSGASVSVLILPGAVSDLAGNPFAGITDATTWNFTVQDTQAPQLTGIFPEDGATGIAVNTNLVMSFDEAMQKGSGTITISDGTTTQTIDVNSDAVFISGNTVIINPPANFGFDATLSVQMPSGVLTDLAGNPFAGITDPAAWNITVAGFVDDVPPLIVSLSPEDNATLVPANTVLQMVFSENVQKGSGMITLNQGSKTQTIDIASASVSISGAKVTIKPGADFDLGAQVHILVPKGAFTDLSNNPFAGIETATGWNFTIDPAIPVSIVSFNFPEVILSNEAATQASIELNRVPEGIKVEFVSRGIAHEQWQKQALNAASLVFTATLPQATFDEIGLEYYFDITLASGLKIASDTGYTYIQYMGNGLDVTGLKFGAQVNAYQIISIPLDLKNKQVNDVLEDNLGEYNINKWRLFNYKNDLLQEYQDGFTTLEAGEAYWLIVRNEANVNTGEGTTLKVRKNNPYTLLLKKGWNQIGNPYNFNVSWTDVRTYNKNPEGLGNLRAFEEEFIDTDLLKKQRGAFVFVENDMILQIPVMKNDAANGRISAEQEPKFTPDALWEINFTLKSKEMPYRLAGLGMHPEASQSKDRYDDITVPRFVKYLEMNFKHPEYFAPDFTRDIRPVEENQMWEFTVESNLEPQVVNLQWYSYFSQAYGNGKKLVMLDVNHNRIVDLSRQNQYSFWQDSLTVFKMYFGSPEYIQEHLQSFQTTLSANYPNPFTRQTAITFILSKADTSYQVKLQVYNTNGQKVATLAEGEYASGAYQIEWDGTDSAGRKLPPGMYIYKLETNSESGPASFTRKMVLQ